MPKKILIIDDDNDFAEAVKVLLESNGYSVDYSETSEEGLQKACGENAPDCILLDVMMTSKTEGIEFSRTLRDSEATAQIPVILVTGIRRDLNVPYSLEPDGDFLPVKAVIEKPIRPEALLTAIQDNL
ncbi:MAG: response regulator [Spirochaetales bacterium]|nr:response regulator [Spirochaetales bacterium]